MLPTGSGKTFVAELCIAACKRSTLVVAPTIDLVNQWHRILTEALVDRWACWEEASTICSPDGV